MSSKKGAHLSNNNSQHLWASSLVPFSTPLEACLLESVVPHNDTIRIMIPVYSDEGQGSRGTKGLAQEHSVRGHQDANPDPPFQPPILQQLPGRDTFSLQTEQ